MFCDACGSRFQEESRFCPQCGKPIAGFTATSSAGGRATSHVKLLAIFWLAMSALRVVPAIAIAVMARSNFDFLPPEVPDFVPRLIMVGGFIMLAGVLVGGVVGWGLLTWQPWARMAAIAFGCINLLSIPFGTALGIYTLWVLLPEQSGREYQARALATNSYPA